MHAKTKAAASLLPPFTMTNLRQSSSSASTVLTDERAKQVLKEAVDAVVNSFAKHTQGYGRGKIILWGTSFFWKDIILCEPNLPNLGIK